MKHLSVVLLAGVGLMAGAWRLRGAEGTARYALILSDPPAAERLSSLKGIRGASASTYRDRVRAAQISLERELSSRQLRVTGAVQTLLNAVFVESPKGRERELRTLPGVKAVAPLHRFRRTLNRAVPLQNVPAAWAALGGTASAGAGVKIAILDTGIDQAHPAFQDSSLKPPSGFPKCTDGAPQDCSFTNAKVIVARSYVGLLSSGTRPDDVSPRDHVGHGTALAMIAAGNTNTGPAGPITGIAPKAWLGSYKVFGSPGLNDFTGGDVLIQALEQAVNDGMDIAVLALGSPALTGPLDTGSLCGAPSGTPCDPEAQAVENAAHAGMLVVASAGNSGNSALNLPTLNTVESPATAPSAIAVGASTNSHMFANTVRVAGSGVPSNLQAIPAVFGDGPPPGQPLTGPLKDVSTLDGSGTACNPLPSNSLSGALALIVRSQNVCTFLDKITNAANAGAIGVIFMLESGDESLFVPGGLTDTHIPSVLIGAAEGAALRSYVASHPAAQVSLDPRLSELDARADVVPPFSSRGPSINYLLKPELVAVGTDVYMATQKFDPNGEMYDPSGYTVASGTSFSAPMVAGAAALVKQKNPAFTAAELKSAVVAAATQDVTAGGQPARASAGGNGKLNAAGAVQTTVTTDPATISFVAIGQTATLPVKQQITIHYAGTSAAALTLSVSGGNPPALDKNTLSFSPGQADQVVTLTLSGRTPPPGIYEGALTIQGGAAPLRLPWMYMVGDGVPFNMIPLLGDAFDGSTGQAVPGGLGFKVVDQYGVAVQNLSVRFTPVEGGGAIRNAGQTTDIHGVAVAGAVLGPDPGRQSFEASAGGLTHRFLGFARGAPVIHPNGIVNAASFQADSGIVPGSYISLFGAGLSDTTAIATGVPLPLAISQTSVSFEVPQANLSLPGAMLYASPDQINVQAPWELSGQASAQIRVNIGSSSGQAFTAAIAQHAPAIYVNADGTAAALDENLHPVTRAHPAARGHRVQLFANGLGAVDNPPPTGSPAPREPLAHTVSPVSVTIGGQPATVEFSGLAPDFPGLNQVNCVVPAGVPSGVQPVVVTIGGVSSPPVNLPLQ